MTTSKQVKARFGKIIRLGDSNVNSSFQKSTNDDNPGKDSVAQENANTGERAIQNAENKTTGDREHQFSVEEQNASQRQR